MISSRRFLLVAGCALSFLLDATSVWASDARVVKMVGSGDAYYAPEGAAQVKIQGTGSEMIPEHAVITTGPGVELYIETFSGAVATIRQNTTVSIQELSAGTTRKARLRLTSGDVVSTLDPSRKNDTDYGIVTPTGVAAARGTVFSVRVVPEGNGNANSSVATLSGIVEIDRGPGMTPLRVPYGQISANSTVAQTLAALAASDPTVSADIVAAVQIVAVNVASATSAAGSAGNSTAELAAVTSAATNAVPSQAAAIVHAAVQGAVTSGSATSGSQSATLAAVAAITEAAVRAVAQSNPQQISNITEAAASAVTTSGTATSGSEAALSAAVAAVTSAAVSAAPGQGAAAAQGAAKGVIETEISGAVSAAKANNPNITTEQLAAIANDASNSSAATAAVSVIATAATSSVLASTGQTGNTAISGATASAIAAAVNSGSSSGATGAASAALGSTTTQITAPTVTINITQGSGGSTVSSTANGAVAHSTSSETVAGHNLSAITIQTTTPTGTTTTNTPPPLTAPGASNSAILPPLDQTQPVVSPSKP
jgi:hypothetical protein